jgi:hypothetical protein
MTESIPMPTDTQAPSAPAGAGREEEPLGALLVGGVFGAIGFALSALWLGAVLGIEIALVAAIIAFGQKARGPASIFVAVAALCAIALLPSTIAIIAAALCFASGLVLAARRPT